MGFSPGVFEVRGDFPHVSGRVVAVKVRKLSWKDEILQHRFPEEGQVALPALSLFVVGGPWGIESVDDQVGCEAGEELND